MRLIDADKLKDSIINEYWRGKKTLMQVIDTQPTAYDVDKVVEQIEDIREKEYVACTDEDCGYCKYDSSALGGCWEGEMSDKLALDKAIEIVKGGGVE